MGRNFVRSSSDNVNCGSAANIDGFTQYTICAWIFYTPTLDIVGYSIASKGDAAENVGWNFFIDRWTAQPRDRAGITVIWDGGGAEWHTENNTADAWEDVWTHLAVTYDGSDTGGNAQFYENGSSITTIERTAPSGNLTDDSGQSFIIGAFENINFWDGGIAEVMYFNSVLTVAQINTAMRRPWHRRPANIHVPLIGYPTTEPDFSGNGNDGTVNGTSVTDHPPIPLIGWDAALPYEVAVVAAPPPGQIVTNVNLMSVP